KLTVRDENVLAVMSLHRLPGYWFRRDTADCGLQCKSGMTEAQLVTVALATIPTFLAVLVAIFINNHRLNDVRDLLRAEMSKNQSELLQNSLMARSSALKSGAGS